MSERLFSTRQVARVSGASERQVDVWTRQGLLVPVVPARGSGSKRRFDFGAVVRARLALLLSQQGLPVAPVLAVLGDKELAPGLGVRLDLPVFTQAVLERMRELDG